MPSAQIIKIPVLQLTLLNDRTILLNVDHIVAVEDNDGGALVITTAQYKGEAVMYTIKQSTSEILKAIYHYTTTG